ncbi:hypothetical protein DFJ73DRAFT_827554 [Zopfochytrium polystomum]|nr:hypothetical protein DFJ73DRAFT_827554 [Zopfochytrium polystomum]
MELLKAQEQSLLKDLPEEEREKFSNESRLYRSSGGKGLADVDPLAVGGVTFDSIGGLEDHIRSLKEMVVMPLLYPEIFSSFNISAPRGVLFYGPPGTGKTLMARALATSCSTSSQKVAFFMRKGADVLSKWVGESERQLRLLFEEAKTYQPSIIFFDEIDGLAPVRSSKQDQIHASIVSTLLALMDGLDNRGQVVVIGATNRIDAIDPALRRPGRFDREFFFPLPPEPARRRIIEITTSRWNPPLSEPLLEELAKATRGYGGADVKALCTEAALNAVRRCYPEIYDSTHKLLINTQDILVTKEDFMTSMKKIIPSTERSAVTHAKPLPSHVQPLVSRAYNQLLSSLDVLCPILTRAAEAQVPIITSTHDRPNPLSSFISPFIYSQSMQPRILICGEPGMGQRFLGPAALHVFESKKFHIQSLDLATILNESGRTAEAALIQIVNEVRRHRPAVLYIPNLDVWWSSLPDAAHSVFLNLLSLDSSVPFVLLASCESPFEEIDPDLQKLVCGSIGLQGKLEKMEGWRRLIVSRPPSESDREKFFDGLLEAVRQPPLELVAAPRTAPRTEPLQRAPSPPPRKLTDAETDALLEHEANLRRQLRMELRFILNDIKRVKRFSDFHRPVDPDAYPDYYLIVTQPMDLETMLWKVNNDEYSVVDEFVEDFERIVRSAEEFNQAGSAIIAKALDLFDTCMLYINTLKKREPEFVWELKQAAFRCRLLNEQRKREGLPELGKRGRRARQPETDVEDSPPKPVAEGKRSSQRLRGEKPDLSTEDARLLENVRAARSSTPKEADTDSGAIGNSTPIRVSTKPFLDDRAMEVDSDVGPTASPSNEDGPATPLVPTAISPVNHRNQILSVESLLAPSPTSASSFPPVEMPGQPILPTPPNSIDSEALPIFASSSKALPSTAPSRPSSSSSAQRTQQMDEPREVSFDQSAIDAIRRELVEETRGKSVAEVEALGVAVAGVIIRNSANWDRRPMIKEIASVLERSRGLW